LNQSNFIAQFHSYVRLFAAFCLFVSLAQARGQQLLTITSPATQVAVGGTLQLTAVLNPPLTGAVNWSVLPTSGASVDQTGLVKGLKSGPVTITATVPATGTAAQEIANFRVQVTLVGSTLSGISVSCPSTVLQLGSATQCVADGTYVNGTFSETEPVPAANFEWSQVPAPTAGLPAVPVSVSLTGMATGVALTPSGGAGVVVTGAYKAGGSATAPAAGVPVTPSAGITVVAAPGPGPQAQFGAAPVAGTSVVTVLPQASGDTISIWAFQVGSGFPGTCAAENMKYGRPLEIKSTTGSGSSAATTTTTAFSLGTAGSAPSATPLTINELLVQGELLCLVETPAGSSSVASWSKQDALAVVDPNDFGRVRPYFVLGMQATNQQTASGNSSVAQYLEAGLNFTNYRARDHWIGLGSNLDIRLSPIPVAGSVSNSTLSGSTLSVSSITPNQLSSQQSVRGVASVYAPIKVLKWNKQLDYFTFAPLGRAGVGTLLNSSMSSSSGGSAGSAPTQIATTSFAPGLYFWGVGARIAWDRIGKDWNKGSQMMTQFLMTVGEYSNLPSYVCKPTTGLTNPYAVGAMTTVTTACSQFGVTGGGTGTDGKPLPYNYYGYFRTVRPRLDVEGLAKLPGYPFVLGLDANLQQYAVWTKPNMDYLNKPGNDVRIWVGIMVDIQTLISKL
jgi:hypothetical protein